MRNIVRTKKIRREFSLQGCYLNIIISLLFLAFLTSCGSNAGTGRNTSSVTITIGTPGTNDAAGLNKAAIPSSLDNGRIIFTISGNDMSTITKEVLLSGQTAITETFDVPKGDNRSFKVDALDSSGNVLYIGEKTGVKLDGNPITLDITMEYAVPTAPTGVTAVASDTQTTISWTAVSGATSYNIYWSTTTGVTTLNGTKITGATSPYTHTGLINGAAYYFIVTAVNLGGESIASSQVSASPLPPVPSAPTGVSASAGDTQNTVTWSAVTGATSYNIYWSTTTGVTTSNGTKITGATSPYTHTGLTNGTTYYYIVTAANLGGESIASSQVSAIPLPSVPSAPTGVSASAGDTQTTISWSAVSGATSYNIYWSTTAGVTTANGTKITGATSPYTHTGLTNGTTYYYIVTAVNAGGESVASSQVSATPLLPGPSAPTGVSTSAGDTQTSVSWTAVTGAVSYNIYWSTTTGVTTSSVNKIIGATSPYTHTGRTNGTTYYYIVTAVNLGGESAASAQVSATPQVPAPAAPGFWDGSATVGDGTVSVRWLASATATSYKVYYGTTSPVTALNSATPISVTGGTSTTITSLINGTLYYFAVSAVNTGGESALTEQASGTPAAPPAAPTGVTAVASGSVNGAYVVNNASSTVSVIDTTTNTVIATIPVGSWPVEIAVNSQTNRAYVVNDGSNTVSVIDTTLNTVIATIPVGSLPYAVAVNPQTNMAYVTNYGSNTVSVIDTATNAVVATISVVAGSYGVAVNPQTNRAYVANYGSNTVSVIDTATNAVLTTIAVGTNPYGVSVNPQTNMAYVSNLSDGTVSVIDTTTNAVVATIGVGVAPANVAVNPQTNRAYVTNWSSGTVSVIDTTTNTVVATIAVGVNPIGVEVNPQTNMAYVTNKDSGTVSVIDTTTNTVIATITVGSWPWGVDTYTAGSNNQVSITWTAVAGATSYNIYRSTTSGVLGTLIGTSSTSSYADTTAVGGTTYYYIVTAVNAGGESGASVEVSAATAPGAPTGVSASAGDSQTTVTWSASTGATSYNIYWSTASGVTTANGTKITGAASPYNHTPLTNGTAYYYIVTAVNAGGESVASSQVSASPLPPIPSAPTGVSASAGDTQTSVSWTAVTGAASYNIYWSTTTGVTTSNGTKIPGATLPYTHTLLTNGTTYYYIVTAVNLGGESVASAQVSATLSPPAPGFWDGSPTVGDGTVSVQWLESAGATSYKVYYGTTSPVTALNSSVKTGITGTSTTITGLTNSTTYFFAVSAVNAGGESALTDIGSGTPTVPPASAPTGVTAVSGDSRVAISWNSVAGAAWYYVYWSTSPGVTTASASIYAGTATSLTHSPLTNGTPYYYIVQAANAAGATLSAEVRSIPGAGVTWTGRTSGTTNALNAAAWSGTQFAAVGAFTTLRTSPDGITWTTRTDPTGWGYDMFGVAWSGTQFATGGVAGTLLTSPTGATWTSQTTPTGNDFRGFAWDGSKFVGVVTFGAINTSTNGTTWAVQTSGTANSLYGVTWGGNQFVAVGAAGTILTSPDGTLWAVQTSGTTNILYGVACSPAICVAVGSAVSTPFYTILSSSNGGITWTPRTSTATSALNAVNWNGAQFLAVGALGTVLSSPDGITWTAQTSGTANALNGITWDGTQYVVVGAGGTILVSHSPFMGGAIQKQLASTGVVTTFAGSAGVTGSTDTATGPATLARFNAPYGITTDGTSLYMADAANNTIRQVVIPTGVVTTLAGSAGVIGSTDGTGTAALFNDPFGITTVGTSLYVADTLNNTIRKIVIATGAVTTIAGSAGVAGSTDGTGTAALFNYPSAITTDGTNLYVADTINCTIRKIVIATGAVTTLAGAALTPGSTDNATGTLARFKEPTAITTDGTNLYVADTYNFTIRQVSLTAPYAVTTIAGSAGVAGSTDGTGTAALFNYPSAITTDGTNLYVADTVNHTIRKIVRATGAVTTIAGTVLTAGSADGTGATARFNTPYGITTDGTSLYVADTANHTIREIQ